MEATEITYWNKPDFWIALTVLKQGFQTNETFYHFLNMRLSTIIVHWEKNFIIHKIKNVFNIHLILLNLYVL